jgi:hypothetical protein
MRYLNLFEDGDERPFYELTESELPPYSLECFINYEQFRRKGWKSHNRIDELAQELTYNYLRQLGYDGTVEFLLEDDHPALYNEDLFIHVHVTFNHESVEGTCSELSNLYESLLNTHIKLELGSSLTRKIDKQCEKPPAPRYLVFHENDQDASSNSIAIYEDLTQAAEQFIRPNGFSVQQELEGVYVRQIVGNDLTPPVPILDFLDIHESVSLKKEDDE